MLPNYSSDPRFQQRFLAKLLRVPSGCLEWQGSKAAIDYGHIRCDGRLQYAHRIAWQIANGPIPDGLCCLHHCDNPICCEPSHLFLGTQADNMHDRDAKGRLTPECGERNAQHKLTENQVREIRALYQPYSREYSHLALAKRFGVSSTQIWKIVNRKKWNHI
jgi:hypothetical protein